MDFPLLNKLCPTIYGKFPWRNIYTDENHFVYSVKLALTIITLFDGRCAMVLATIPCLRLFMTYGMSFIF